MKLDKVNSIEKLHLKSKKQTFLGVVKFYDTKKGFGYVVANNFGMPEELTVTALGTVEFRISEFSMPTTFNIKQHKLVSFELIRFQQTFKLINLREYRKETDKSLALEYYYNNNFINYKAKKRDNNGSSKKKTIEVQYRFSIFASSGIYRYEMLHFIINLYDSHNIERFTNEIEHFVEIIGGDSKYYKYLTGFYDNKEKEIQEIENMFNIIDDDTIHSLVLKHKAFQKFAPSNKIQNIIGELDESFGIPQGLYKNFQEVKLNKIINEGKTFDLYYDTVGTVFSSYRIHRRNDSPIESLLSVCPNTSKHYLEYRVSLEMKRSILNLIKRNSPIMTIKDKETLKRRYVKFIDTTLETLINDEIYNDRIKEINISMNTVQLGNDAQSLVNGLRNMTKLFFLCSEEKRQNLVLQIKATFIKVFPKVLDSILYDFYHRKDIFQNNDAIQEIMFENEFVHNYCYKELLEYYKKKLIIAYRDSIMSEDSSGISLRKMLIKTLSSQELTELDKKMSQNLIQKASLRVIYKFHKEHLKKELPCSFYQLIQIKDIDDIVDCGSAFEAIHKEGIQCLYLIFEKIEKSKDINGHFIKDHKKEKDRLCFIARLFADFKDECPSIKYLYNGLSVLDRISLAKSLGRLVLTKDEIKQEFIKRGVNGDCRILYEYCNGLGALIELITELEYDSPSALENIVSWIKVYMSIDDRRIHNREIEEEKVICYLKGINKKTKYNFSRIGVFLEEGYISPCLKDYYEYKDFIVTLRNAQMYKDEVGVKLDIPYNFECDTLEKKFMKFICNKDGYLKESITLIDDKNKIPYMILLFLSNINLFKIKTEKEISIGALDSYQSPNKKMIGLVECIVNMTATYVHETFWRVGDRPDIQTDRKNINITLPFSPSIQCMNILSSVIPDIKRNKNTNTFSYSYEYSYTENGYGREYDYDYSTEYKDNIVGELLIRMVNAYKIGITLSEALNV